MRAHSASFVVSLRLPFTSELPDIAKKRFDRMHGRNKQYEGPTPW